jgi:EmrB/QacA subfamily drug resistance transporter
VPAFAPASTERDRIPAHVWRIAAVVVVGSIASILDTTIVNVALEGLSRELHSPIGDIQWVVTGYLLALAAVIPITGWAARRVGVRRLYVLSLIGFTISSALCGLAWSTGSLIAFRVLQGAAGGLVAPVGQMILVRAAGPTRLGRVMSVVGIPMVLAPVLGPVIGGLIVDNWSWRWIFLVNLPVGVIAATLALRLLPRDEPEGAGAIDRLGFALLALGLPAVTYGLAEVGEGGGSLSARSVVPLLAGLALVGAFIVHALHPRGVRPILDIRLFANRAFASASVTIFCLGATLFGAMILLPLYFQTVRGETAVATGLLLAPQGLGAGLAMPFAGRLTDRYGGGLLAVVGIIVTVVATVPLTLVTATTAYPELSVALFVRGLGIGLAIMPAMTAAFAVLRRDQVPDATPQLNVLMRLGGSLGTALLAVILQHGLTGATTSSEAAGAFADTYVWVMAITAVAIVPAAILARVEWRRRHALAAEAARETAVVPEPVASG